jgi:hypothetical protein
MTFFTLWMVSTDRAWFGVAWALLVALTAVDAWRIALGRNGSSAPSPARPRLAFALQGVPLLTVALNLGALVEYWWLSGGLTYLVDPAWEVFLPVYIAFLFGVISYGWGYLFLGLMGQYVRALASGIGVTLVTTTVTVVLLGERSGSVRAGHPQYDGTFLVVGWLIGAAIVVALPSSCVILQCRDALRRANAGQREI